MTAFDRLLEVQENDTALDRLRHQRSRLQQRAELESLGRQMTEVESRLAATRERLQEVERRQAQLEDDAAAVGERVRGIEKRMYSGEVSATRDLLAMTAEVEALNSRRSSLDDEALAAMEEAEPLTHQIAAAEAEIAGLRVTASEVGAALGVAEAEIDAEAEATCEQRRRAAEQVPPDLLATYEKLRASLGGVGAARLVGTSCSGCHLTLPASEVARIKREPADALVVCDQCGRILVR